MISKHKFGKACEYLGENTRNYKIFFGKVKKELEKSIKIIIKVL